MILDTLPMTDCGHARDFDEYRLIRSGRRYYFCNTMGSVTTIGNMSKRNTLYFWERKKRSVNLSTYGNLT